MKNYDEQYYFLQSVDDDSHPVLTPNASTKDRSFRFEKQPFGSPPFVFLNGAKDHQQKMNIPVIEEPPEILFDGDNILVPSRIREALLMLDISNLNMHPAIYIHDDGKWYENYWYMTFTEEFDCWDRSSSIYEDGPMEIGGFTLFNIYKYSLNKEVFDKSKIESRLLFKMGGSLNAFIVCEKSLASLFPDDEKSGMKLILVSDY